MKSSFSIENDRLSNVYDDGYLRVEHDGYTVFCNQEYIKLSRTQFLILSRLVQTPKAVVKSEELWQQAWNNRKSYNPLSLHVYLYRLRRKLEPFEITIETLVNVGYRFMPRR